MSSYWIWDPHLVDEGRAVDLILTPGIVNQLNRPNRAFATSLLQDIGIDRKASGIKVTPYRTCYYTDYLESQDWRDFWQPAWSLLIRLTTPATKIGARDRQVGADAIAASGSRSPSAPSEVRCLVIADFRNDESLAQAVAAIGNDDHVDGLRKKWRQRPPNVSHFPIRRGLFQLRVDLGLLPMKFYSEDPAYARAVMDVCSKYRGTSHVRQREP